MMKILEDVFKLTLDNFGPAVAVVVFIIFSLLWYIHRTYEKFLKSKDEEIARLCKEKERLQTLLLKDLKKQGKQQ